VLYDVAGRGAWSGPALLAACRGGNLLAGVAFGVAAVPSLWVLGLPVVLLYASFVFVVSRLGRLEDAEDEAMIGQMPTFLLWTAAMLLLLAPVAARSGLHSERWPTEARTFASVLLVGLAALGIVRASRVRTWTRALVMRGMGVSLRRLLVFTAAVALTTGGTHAWIVAGLILAGFPISYALRGVFPPS